MSAYIVPIGKRTPRDAAQDAAELCRLANSLNRLNENACNVGLTERQERRKQNLQTRIKTVLERALGPQPLQTAIREATPCTRRVPRLGEYGVFGVSLV